jgi:hypothetical protein
MVFYELILVKSRRLYEYPTIMIDSNDIRRASTRQTRDNRNNRWGGNYGQHTTHTNETTDDRRKVIDDIGKTIASSTERLESMKRNYTTTNSARQPTTTTTSNNGDFHHVQDTIQMGTNPLSSFKLGTITEIN